MNTLHDSPNRHIFTRRLAATVGAGSLALTLSACGTDEEYSKFNSDHPSVEITLPETTNIDTLSEFVEEYCEQTLDPQETRDAVYLIQVENKKSTALIMAGDSFRTPVALCDIIKSD